MKNGSIKAAGNILLIFILFTAGMAAADDAAVLRVANQKARLKILLELSGELKNAPYKIEFSEFPTSAPLTEALNAGAVDIGWIGDAPLVFAVAAGAPIKAIGTVKSEATSAAIIAPANSPLNGAASLRGKRIATTRGSIGHYLTVAALRTVGLKSSDVQFIFLAPGDARALLLNGSADAWATWDPYTILSETQDHTKVVVAGQGLFPGNSFLVANDDAVKNKHEQLQDFLQRLDRALRWSQHNIDAYAAAQAKVSGLEPAVVAETEQRAKHRLIAIDTRVIAELQDTANLYRQEGVVKNPFDAQRAFDRSFSAQ